METTTSKGSSWSEWTALSTDGIHRSPSLLCACTSSNPRNTPAGRSPGGCTPHPGPCGSSAGSSETSAMTPPCSGGATSMRKPCWACGELSESPPPGSTAAVSLTSRDSHRLLTGKSSRRIWSAWPIVRRPPMTYSYTQISQYLRCPRSYRYRYLDGWKERDTRASLLFGRAFEKALAAFFTGEDSSAALVKQWGAYQEAQVEYSKGDNWERMFRQGVQLLERLAQDDRIQIDQPLH